MTWEWFAALAIFFLVLNGIRNSLSGIEGILTKWARLHDLDEKYDDKADSERDADVYRHMTNGPPTGN
jgi:hypothetical protein